MKKILKVACFLILTGFSFYFTEKTAILVRNQDPIMQAIKEASVEMNHEAVNASITKDYIIPGINGRRINEIKSLMQMKENNVFNSLFLVTESVKPKVSLNDKNNTEWVDDNKDKIIIKGNPKKGAISFIIESKDTPSYTYLKSHNIQASLLTKSDTYDKAETLEQLNNDFENYKKLENKLNKAKTNTNICILNNYNKEICLKYNKYLVEPSITLNKSNLVDSKSKIESGSIILLSKSTTTEELEHIINYLTSKNLKIVTLSSLISE